MAIRFSVKTLEAVPEALREFYVKDDDDGIYVLDYEGDPPGFVPASKASEWRSNNRSLNGKLEEKDAEIARLNEALTGFKDIDPKKYKEALTKLSELEKAGAGTPPDVQALIDRAVKAAQAPVLAQLEELKTSSAKLTEEKRAAELRAARRAMESDVTNAALKAGVNEAALPDVLFRAGQIFVVDPESGRYQAQKDDKTPIFGRNGDPLTVDEWLKAQAKDAPHLFKPNKGGATQEPSGGAKETPPGTYDSDSFFQGTLSDDRLRELTQGKIRPAGGEN